MALTVASPGHSSPRCSSPRASIRPPRPRSPGRRPPRPSPSRWPGPFPSLPDDPELLVRVNGAVQLGAGALLAIGRFRRLAAVALHRLDRPHHLCRAPVLGGGGPDHRAQQQVHFLKNLGLLGGLILAATDTEGAPSLGWRARRRAARIGAAVAIGRPAGSSRPRRRELRRRGAGALARHAQSRRRGGRHLDDGASRADQARPRGGGPCRPQADATGRHLAESLPAVGHQAADAMVEAGKRTAESVTRAARTGADLLARYLATGADRAGDLVERASGPPRPVGRHHPGPGPPTLEGRPAPHLQHERRLHEPRHRSRRGHEPITVWASSPVSG